MAGGDLYQSTPKQNKPAEARSPKSYTKIPRRTKERQSDEKYYIEQAKEFFNDAVINGTNICVFCGEKVTTFQGLHHWKGRTNDYLLDKQWWSVVHNDCHLFFHRSTFAQLKQRFGDMFFERLQKFNYSLWETLMKRSGKGERISPTLFSENSE